MMLPDGVHPGSISRRLRRLSLHRSAGGGGSSSGGDSGGLFNGSGSFAASRESVVHTLASWLSPSHDGPPVSAAAAALAGSGSGSRPTTTATATSATTSRTRAGSVSTIRGRFRSRSASRRPRNNSFRGFSLSARPSSPSSSTPTSHLARPTTAPDHNVPLAQVQSRASTDARSSLAMSSAAVSSASSRGADNGGNSHDGGDLPTTTTNNNNNNHHNHYNNYHHPMATHSTNIADNSMSNTASFSHSARDAAVQDQDRHPPARVDDLSTGVAGLRLDQPASRQSTPPKQATPPPPMIRLYPYQNPYSPRPSLTFSTITRTLPTGVKTIRVGRYSERDADSGSSSSSAVGFKSKVVSRRHCELSYLDGSWHIQDVGSSSGTFLNHMRLSQPNAASRLYPVRDGDIIQLGMDFRGGEETIFRCVRMRIECNRTWQTRPNEFNKNTAALIDNLGKGNTAEFAGCRECSICLGSVLVCSTFQLRIPYQLILVHSAPTSAFSWPPAPMSGITVVLPV